MGDDIYATVLDRLRRDLKHARDEEADLRKQLEAIQQRLKNLLQAEESIARMLGESVSEQAGPKPGPATVTTSGSRYTNGRTTTPRHADVAEHILRSKHVPMRVSEIVARMRAMGHPLPDDERIADSAVYSALDRRRGTTVKRIGRGLWGLREWADMPQLGLNTDEYEDEAQSGQE